MGRPFTGSSPVWIIIGTGLLIAGAYSFSRYQGKRTGEKTGRPYGPAGGAQSEAIIKAARRALIVLALLLAVEAFVGTLAWPMHLWQGWIVGVLGTTIVALALVGAILIFRPVKTN